MGTPCRHLPLNEEEEHGANQHCEEADTSGWQDEDMDEIYNNRNNSKRLHTQNNYWWRKDNNTKAPSIEKIQNIKRHYINAH